jgi:hypothetical protein
MPKRAANWEEIRREFVFTPKESRPTLRELSEKHNVKLRTIRAQSEKYGWHLEAEQFDKKIHQERQLSAVSRNAQKFHQIDDLVLSLSENLLNEINNSLAKKREDGKQFKSYEINQFAQSIKALHSLSTEIRGDLPKALDVLLDEGMIDESKRDQISFVLAKNESNAREEVNRVIAGNYPD